MSLEFRIEENRLALRRAEAAGLSDLLAELIDWRLAASTDASIRWREMDDAAGVFLTGPEPWREYMREEIPPLFGAMFNAGN